MITEFSCFFCTTEELRRTLQNAREVVPEENINYFIFSVERKAEILAIPMSKCYFCPKWIQTRSLSVQKDTAKNVSNIFRLN